MKIGFLIPEFPGQTHSFFWREISHLMAESDHEARVVSTRLPPQPVEHSWTAELDVDYLFPPSPSDLVGAVLRLVPLLPRLLLQADTRRCLRGKDDAIMLLMASLLAGVCKRQQIDHLHVHSCANAALIAAFLNRMTGMPYSLVLHGPIMDYGPNQEYKWDRAAFGFVITERLKAEILTILPELEGRLSIVPMGVDTNVFAPTGLSRADGPWRWFSCGRLNRVKGFDTLIEAASKLKAEGTEFEIRVAGEDEQGGMGYRKDIERMISEAGLEAEVTLLGAVEQNLVLAEMQRADGFVLASRHEPLGVVYMEAMACGLPTIATDAGGVKELIEDGVSGLLVPPQDPEALAMAMKTVMGDPGLVASLAAGGRERIVSDFDAARSAREIVAHLDVSDLSGVGKRSECPA